MQWWNMKTSSRKCLKSMKGKFSQKNTGTATVFKPKTPSFRCFLTNRQKMTPYFGLPLKPDWSSPTQRPIGKSTLKRGQWEKCCLNHTSGPCTCQRCPFPLRRIFGTRACMRCKRPTCPSLKT
uniref:Uncharacterized 14.1 kDa protein in ORF1 coding strand n=1 Tax=Papaya mosaic potexvirus TaxID=12181 RepID=Y14K_PMV|nr:RecName: Full=Uncharacterized 14.1 kDa protein in ORF1 coding strand [Papaya mosaic virus]